ncbi:protocatechuate dioxygenase [Streptomyces sp. CB03911]|uniref:protocatechuate dioxygenase n=1 Tax=Streptomyces sp. CB03911 TaxID=1804758 RepID=UPI00093FADF6|nr:protocatechuate dioxygenase [Streptomyces sp. CB03911]OKI12116.1 protocatechuate dioxygenase [Streptomyces sp. CB03911]
MGHDHEGQRVSRRTALAGISSIGLGALLAACGQGGGSRATTTTGASASVSPQSVTTEDLTSLFAASGTCTLTAGTTQGPYYFDADKIRGDIREDRAGTRLRLAVRIQDSESCAAIPNAVVEIWHCDAAGLYSGAESLSSGGGGGAPGGAGGTPPAGAPSGAPAGGPDGAPPSGGPDTGGAPGGAAGGAADLTPTDDKRYLRGAQVTNADGIVQFTTIWPGWYAGRTVHIHAMVHVDNERTLTTQLMMDEKLNSAVFAKEPYSRHTGRDTFNDGDSIYRPGMLLTVSEDGDGYLGVITLAADPDHNGK